MNKVHVLYHLARADFLERVRRYSFLIMLGLVVFLGYQAAIGNVNLQVGDYRGEYNSAWVGSMMAVIASFFLGWFGFYLVKGSVARDRETGVGQIMATTPLTRPLYIAGKWLSNFAVLISMVLILVLVGVLIQIFTGEDKQLELVTLIAPFLLISLPMLAFTAAMAVLFEAVGFLSGGFGNVVYFFLFLMILPLADSLRNTSPALDPLGFGLLQQSMGAAAKVAFPDYDGGFVLGSSDIPIKGIFHWSGVEWTPEIILQRLISFGVAIALIMLATLFFDRFDPSRARPRRMKRAASVSGPEVVTAKQTLSQPVRLTPLSTSTQAWTFASILVSELRLLLKGGRWWWYVVAAGLIVAALANTAESVRANVLPLTWLWPMLIWSKMGNREIRSGTNQIVFSAPGPLWRQLPASWLAGFFVAVLTGTGVALKLLSAGDEPGLIAWMSGALFIPSFALALGIWSHGNKLFEVLYVAIWYIGPMSMVPALDYLGAHSSGNIGFFIPFTVALMLLAFIGRARQLRT